MGNLTESAAARRPPLTPTGFVFVAFIPTGIVNVLLGPLLPALSARWALTDAQAGVMFTAQFLASTVGVLCSGVLVPRYGYRSVLVLGLIFMALGVWTLPLGSWIVGIAAVAGYGAGFGLTIPTANLLVAEANPAHKASALNLLNFAWSVGAVACPFLVAHFQRTGQTSLFLGILGTCILLVGISLVAARLPQPGRENAASTVPRAPLSSLLRTPAAIALGTLFFAYVGTENAVGGWLASYAKRLTDSPGAGWATAPSYFYGALLLGRLFVPLLLRRVSERKTAQIGVAVALFGLGSLLAAGSMWGVRVSACVAGLGLAAIYPITIALLSHKFGPAAPRLGSIMFALAGVGAACFPWLVGFISTELSSLRLGLTAPLVACALMLVLYLGRWTTEAAA
jgi:fucose permease